MTRKLRLVLAAMTLVIAAACVTVNIYFPAAKVEKTADEIVDDVYGSGAETEDDSRSALESFLALLATAPAYAEDATSVSNAAIRGLKNDLRMSHQKIAAFYRSGNIGVSKDGFVAVRTTQGLNLKQVSKMKKGVNIQNQTRKKLYAEVTKALNLPSSQEEKVRQVFADKWRGEAPAGWWVQDDGGNWQRK